MCQNLESLILWLLASRHKFQKTSRFYFNFATLCSNSKENEKETFSIWASEVDFILWTLFYFFHVCLRNGHFLQKVSWKKTENFQSRNLKLINVLHLFLTLRITGWNMAIFFFSELLWVIFLISEDGYISYIKDTLLSLIFNL